MASVPGYSATTGRSRTAESPRSSTRDDAVPRSESSSAPPTGSLEDRETVFLNKPPSSEDTLISGKPPASSVTTVDEPRKCWICYTDETEDSPLNHDWRSPCPCALTAHEACLLDWLADLENPRSRKRNGRHAKMVCPQCKSEIVVSRPRSYIVEVMRLVEGVAARLVLPGLLFTAAGTVWAGCCAHGVYSMYLVFGTEDARHVLEDTAEGTWNSGLNLGLPLIPLALIFSRTRYAEGLLPAIPVLFFATHNPGQEPDMELWPPSATMTFAALPYVKSFYSALYDRLFGQLERKWIAEVQPRQSDINEFDDNAPAELPVPGNGQVLMEIDVGFQMGEDDDDDNDDPQEALGLGGNNGQGAQNQPGRRDDIICDTGNLPEIILGALAFPAISASMGGLLKYVLPKSWTAASSLERSRPGLLQTRWGRSVVGGCVFVLLKDALVLYCRWKLAQTHRRRKVLNYDRTKRPSVGGKR